MSFTRTVAPAKPTNPTPRAPSNRLLASAPRRKKPYLLCDLNRADAGENCPAGMMPIADHLAAPGGIHDFGVALNPLGHFGVNRLRQQALRAITQDLRQNIATRGWNRCGRVVTL
jgi:hypothetical protein